MRYVYMYHQHTLSLICYSLFVLLCEHCQTTVQCLSAAHKNGLICYSLFVLIWPGNLPCHDWKVNTPHSQGGN